MRVDVFGLLNAIRQDVTLDPTLPPGGRQKPVTSLSLLQGAVGKRKEFEGMQAQGKVGQAEVAEMGQRTDTLSYALLAEINTFHSQRLKDMKLVHQQFLQEQIKFYQKESIMLYLALYPIDKHDPTT